LGNLHAGSAGDVWTLAKRLHKRKGVARNSLLWYCDTMSNNHAAEKALIDKALEACGGNMTRLAEKAEVSRQVVQHWKRKGRLPAWRLKTVRQIAGIR